MYLQEHMEDFLWGNIDPVQRRKNRIAKATKWLEKHAREHPSRPMTPAPITPTSTLLQSLPKEEIERLQELSVRRRKSLHNEAVKCDRKLGQTPKEANRRSRARHAHLNTAHQLNTASLRRDRSLPSSDTEPFPSFDPTISQLEMSREGAREAFYRARCAKGSATATQHRNRCEEE